MNDNILNEYFKRSEFACKCGCGFNTVDTFLLHVCTLTREHFGLPLIVTSGCRCEKHNEAVGGRPGSKHRLGNAADIKIQGIEPQAIYNYIDCLYPDFLGLGLYATHVHVDSRTDKWRG